jgi:hypothetical protein
MSITRLSRNTPDGAGPRASIDWTASSLYNDTP